MLAERAVANQIRRIAEQVAWELYLKSHSGENVYCIKSTEDLTTATQESVKLLSAFWNWLRR